MIKLATRKMDDFGRIVIPRDVREKAFGTKDTNNKWVNMFLNDNGELIIKIADKEDLPEEDRR